MRNRTWNQHCKGEGGRAEEENLIFFKSFGKDCRLQVLQKLQNRASRIVTNSSYDSSASALIKTLNWPTVADMIKVETACMVYKSTRNPNPRCARVCNS